MPDLSQEGITYKTVTIGYTGAITGDATGNTAYIGDTNGSFSMDNAGIILFAGVTRSTGAS